MHISLWLLVTNFYVTRYSFQNVYLYSCRTIINAYLIRNWVRILAVLVRLVEHLVLPHVHIQYHDDENNSIIEPFAFN